MNRNFTWSLWTGLLSLVLMLPAQAATLYDFASAPIRFGEANVTVGFQFTANQNLVVNALGFYDDNQDGLINSHAVGLFDMNGSLLTSTTVQSGTNSELDGKFRYQGISSYNLVSGQSYVLAGLATGDDGYTYGNTGTTIQGLSVNPAFTVNPLSAVFLYASNLSYPNEHFGYDLYPMVNLKFEQPSQVPLPAAFPLFGIGLAGIGAMQRRFLKKQQTI
jgi:hypothetical protein